MSLETKSFEFDGFLLDMKEKVLLREDKPIPITPKAFELLHALVENHGHLVEKDELIKAVWAGSFVEEGNLSYTMRLLRKALDDDSQNPRFIETVSRRGYRFIAEVKETENKNASKTGMAQTVFLPVEKSSANPLRFKKMLLPAAAILIISAIVAVFWYAGSKIGATSAPVLSAPFASEKLSTNGKVLYAAISPDGKNVVITNENGGKQSVWLRQLESGNNVEIIPPSDDVYVGLALSPDGNFLYFTRKPKYVEGQADIYRISIFGGIPTKIIGETQGWVSLAADGGKISFVRCYYREDENCSLWIADASDGRNEKKLASYPRPFRIGDNEFSPGGKRVAFAVGQSENQANEFGLIEVDIESGALRELTVQKFFNIKSLAWLSDKDGLLVTASRIPNKSFNIWHINATGNIQPLTKDSETYSALSLDKDANVIVSTQVKEDFRLNLYNTENFSAAPRVLADARSVAFAPDGKIVFSSLMSGNDEIWSINADGSEQRQLTIDAADKLSPIVSPDNNSIFFTSNRTGESQVWRMNADGSNQIQITKRTGGFPLSVSLDGKWLYYHSGRDKTLWRISTAGGGEEQLVWNKEKLRFAVSPDGLRIAFLEKQPNGRVLMVVSLTDKQTIKIFKLADESVNLVGLKWSQDGENLAYILANGEFENNILWLQPLDKETPQQVADLGDEEIYELSGFALSPDGKSFTVVQGGWRHNAILLKGLK